MFPTLHNHDPSILNISVVRRYQNIALLFSTTVHALMHIGGEMVEIESKCGCSWKRRKLCEKANSTKITFRVPQTLPPVAKQETDPLNSVGSLSSIQ